jgi:hypothetical protein
MTPGEVKSLNDLAMAHGGQLTINPHTGLPEAGFLSAILPILAGVALGPAGFGLMSAGAAGLTVGGLTGLATGSLSKGLMAGMGAYGGAGLGDALAKTGVEQATQAELAKNEAFKQAQQTAGQQASQLGQSYINAAQPSFMGPNMSPEILSENLQSITKPVTDIANNTATNVAVNSGYGGPDYVTSTMGNKINTMGQGISSLGSEAGRSSFMNNIGGGMGLAKYGLAAAAPIISNAMQPKTQMPMATDKDMGQRYTYNPGTTTPFPQPDANGREQRYFNPSYTPVSSDQARSIYHYADGGMAEGGFNLGGYSDGGRLLRGPGDGVSDSIPATIGHKQPARLADGEFVVPARIVSELGNGSTEAGARKLYAMMDRVQSARSKTVGKGKIAANSKADKHLPA